jgi:hypothetical protein
MRYLAAIEKSYPDHQPAIIIGKNSGFIRHVKLSEIQIPARTQFKETKKKGIFE